MVTVGYSRLQQVTEWLPSGYSVLQQLTVVYREVMWVTADYPVVTVD